MNRLADIETPGSVELSGGVLTFDTVADIFAAIAVEAAVPVMAVYEADAHVRRKADSSPVCDADDMAEAIILRRLAERFPDVPVLSEEAAARGAASVSGEIFVLVDPVDGTREFLSRNGEFTINIALVVDGVPRAGAVYAPALAKLWIGGSTASSCLVAPGEALPAAANRQAIRVRKAPSAGLTALASRSHSDPATEAFLARLPVKERRPAGSSLKFCALAEGSADVYPRFGQTMEWDTAAGDAVLRAAGGLVLDETGDELRYGKADAQFRNGPFVAWADPDAARRLAENLPASSFR